MKIENLKELQQLIALLRKMGVDSVKMDGVELHLGPPPYKTPKNTARPIIDDPMASVSVPTPNIQDPISAAKAHAAQQLKHLQDYIETDAPTEEQLTMWSARPEDFEGQQ